LAPSRTMRPRRWLHPSRRGEDAAPQDEVRRVCLFALLTRISTDFTCQTAAVIRKTRLRDLAAPFARVFTENVRHLKIRGRRECRAPAAPAASRAKCEKHTSIVTTVTPEITRHSPRNGFTTYSVLSPVTGLSCHRRLADTSAKLDASVGAPGPHGFAVRDPPSPKASAACPPKLQRRRKQHRSSSALPRPPHPMPNVCDDRETPLYGPGRRWL
jgi:hypothetical protein